jgi:SnoaL-like domain
MDDLQALRLTAEVYARGADRRCREDWECVLAEDIVIVGPGFVAEGREANVSSLGMLDQMFKATRHIIHAQYATVDGDRAQGETWCTAEHRIAGEQGDMLLVWAVRYQDQWRREEGEWRFTRRELVVDWEETRPVRDVSAIGA